MIFHIKKNVTVKCENCGGINTFENSMFAFEEVERNDRQMGSEVHFSADARQDCSNCKNELEIEIEAWEYPEGVLNEQAITPRDCILTEDVTISQEQQR